MDDWKRLDILLDRWLSGFKKRNIVHRSRHHSIKGFPPRGMKSDGMLTDGIKLLAIEVESGDAHPDTSVGKYWLLQMRYRKYQKIILFHIYTPTYQETSRRELGEFYSERMTESFIFEYHLMDFTESTDFKGTYEKIKRRIKRAILTEFK